MNVRIASTGLYLPPRVETAAELAPRIGVSERWIVRRTGVAQRHVADESMSSMGAKAVLDALGDGPLPDLMINASATVEQTIPDSAVFIQRELMAHEPGWAGIPCYSVHATCLSFMVGLQHAAALVAAGVYKRIVVVSSELGTRGRNYDQPESAALLGDGAAAVVIEPSDGSSAILGWAMHTWSEGAELTEVRGGGMKHHPNDPETTEADNLFSMDGPRIYKMARKRAKNVIEEALADAGLQKDQVDLFVPHQSSLFGVLSVTRYGFSEDKVVNVIAEQGNCVAASMPLALATAVKRGRVARGDVLVLGGTGAGLSVCIGVLRW